MQAKAIEVFLGPYRSGKTEALLTEILNSHGSQNNFGPVSSLIITPSRRTAKDVESKLKDLSAKLSSGTYAGIRTESFYQLCQEIVELESGPLKLLPDRMRAAFLAQAVEKLDLEFLRGIRSFAGTYTSLLKLIDEFQKAGLAPEDIEQSLSDQHCKESRLFELASVYKEYLQRLEDLQMVDQRSLAFKARSILQRPDSKKLIDRLCINSIYIEGFDRLNHIQVQVIRGLANFVERTILVFDYARDNSEDERAYAWKQGSLNQVETNLTPVEWRAFERSSHSAKHRIKAFSCLDPFFEMQEVARLVKKMILRDGIAADKIAICARNPGNYIAAAELAFSQAGIDLKVENSRALIELPLVKILLKTASLKTNNFPFRDVLAVLRSPFVKAAKFGFSQADLSYIEREGSKRLLVKGIEQWKKVFDLPESKLYSRLRKFFDLVNPDSNFTDQHYDSISNWVVWFEDLLEQCFLYQPEDSAKWATQEEEELFQAYKGLRDSLGLLLLEEEVLELKSITCSSFINRLENQLRESHFRPIGKTDKAVLFTSAELLPNRCFEAIFIIGLCEGKFPAEHKEFGFAGVEELELWRNSGVALENPRHHGEYEFALFQSIKDRAHKELYLSYPRYEMSQEANTESSFLVEEMDKSSFENVVLIQPFSANTDYLISAREFVMTAVWNFADKVMPELEGLEHPVIKDLVESLSFRLAAALSRRAGQLNSIYNGYLSELVEYKALSITVPEYFSVSQLNDYGKCPFKYWARHSLRISIPEESSGSMSRKDLGILLHRVLELFYSRVIEEKRDFTSLCEQDYEVWLSEAIELALKESLAKPEVHPDRYFEYAKKDLSFRLRRFVQYDQKRLSKQFRAYSPFACEVQFGPAGSNSSDQIKSFAPLVISGNNGNKIKLRGMIDRIDLAYENGQKIASVIDYKTGSTSSTEQDIKAGRNMQLPVYALAVNESVMSDGRAEDGCFLSIRASKRIAGFDFDKNKELLEITKKNIVNFVEQIRVGNYIVKPSNSTLCKTCEYSTACRISEIRQGEADDTVD